MDAGVGHLLGFDYGTRRIGVAVGETVTGGARPLCTVRNGPDGEDWATIERLLRDWRPLALVVGLPLTLDGGEQPMSRCARRFAERLRERSGLVVHLCDERLSSQASRERFAEGRRQGLRRRRQAADIDAVAAQIILEDWLATSRDRHADRATQPSLPGPA